MAIPLIYNVRNLKLRKGLTVMTALGIALTVTTAVFLMALLAGLDKAFMTSGDALNVLVMRKGSNAELSGGFDASLFPTLKTLPGIATDGQGQPLASGEWVVVVVLPRKDGTGEVNVSVRGLMPAGLSLRLDEKGAEILQWRRSEGPAGFPGHPGDAARRRAALCGQLVAARPRHRLRTHLCPRDRGFRERLRRGQTGAAHV